VLFASQFLSSLRPLTPRLLIWGSVFSEFSSRCKPNGLPRQGFSPVLIHGVSTVPVGAVSLREGTQQLNERRGGDPLARRNLSRPTNFPLAESDELNRTALYA
jgi:hypothetical protein